MVIKKDKTKEMYDRQKLKKSLMLSFAKREFNNEKIENLLNNLENKRISEGTEISSKQIGDDILEMLKEIDPVVYIRLASVYKYFDSLEDFRNFIDD